MYRCTNLHIHGLLETQVQLLLLISKEYETGRVIDCLFSPIKLILLLIVIHVHHIIISSNTLLVELMVEEIF
jgi:hypothetical protein